MHLAVDLCERANSARIVFTSTVIAFLRRLACFSAFSDLCLIVRLMYAVVIPPDLKTELKNPDF